MNNPVRADGKFYERPKIGEGETIAIIRPDHIYHAKVTATGRHTKARAFKRLMRNKRWQRLGNQPDTAVEWDKFEGIWLAAADRTAWKAMGK